MFPNSQGADEMSVVYAVIDEDGEVEQWTIAPADLLSFARQVTKAMVSLLLISPNTKESFFLRARMISCIVFWMGATKYTTYICLQSEFEDVMFHFT